MNKLADARNGAAVRQWQRPILRSVFENLIGGFQVFLGTIYLAKEPAGFA